MAENNPFLDDPFDAILEKATPKAPVLEKPAAAEPVDEAPPKAVRSRGKEGVLPPEQYRPLFDDAARKYDVPVNIVMALANQESNYNPKAIGTPTQWGRAKGMMQYLDSTAAGGRINAFDPQQSIDFAAKQVRERLDKGYSMEDAVKEHFAGPDRKLWGEKTKVYGREVMERAARIGDLVMGGTPGSSSPSSTATRNTDLQGKLDAEEPGRYRVLSQDEVSNSFNTALMDREAYGETFKMLNPTAPQSMLDGALKQWDDDNKARQATATAKMALSPNERFDVKLNERLQGPQGGMVQLPGRMDQPATAAPAAPKLDEAAVNSVGTGGALLESLKSGTVNIGAGISYSPEAILKSVDGILDGLDRVGKAIGLPDWMLERKYVGPNDLIAPLIRGKDFGSYHMAGTNDIAMMVKRAGKAIENPIQAEAIKRVGVQANAALDQAIQTGDTTAIVDVLSDPKAWATAFGQAAPSLAVAMLGGVPAIAALEGGGATSELKDYEKQSGRKVGDLEAANAILQTTVINTLLEKLGLDAMLGKLPPQVQQKLLGATIEGVKGRMLRAGTGAGVGMVGEASTEALQQVNENLAKRTNYDSEQSLSDGVLLSAMGGGASGASMGGISGVASAPQQAAPQAEATAPIAPAAPDPTPAQAAGPMSSAVEAAAGKSSQVKGDDGKTYQFSVGENGVTMTEAPPAGPMEAAVEAAAATQEPVATPAPAPVAAPEPAPAPEPKAKKAPATKPTPAPEAIDADGVVLESRPKVEADLTSMDMKALRERLHYIANQAKNNGGFDKRLMNERKRVEREIDSRAVETPVAKPIDPKELIGIPAIADANAAMLKAAEATGLPHEVVERDQKGTTVYDVKPIADQSGSGVAGAASAVKPSEPVAATKNDKSSAEPVAVASGTAKQPAALKNASKEDVEHLFGIPAKREKALKRIEKGTAFFGSKEKAADFIKTNGLKDTHEVVQTGKVRFDIKAKQQAERTASDLGGKDIDGDWMTFADDSGTLNIPRSEMPQIKAEHRGAMVNFLNARGIEHKETEFSANYLKPTQAEFSRKKVEQAKGFEGGDRSILVSSDGHVLDGHHQWLAKRDAGGTIKAIQLDAPIADLLEAIKEFPSATQAEGAATLTVKEPPAENIAAAKRANDAATAPKKPVTVTKSPGITTIVLDPSAMRGEETAQEAVFEGAERGEYFVRDGGSTIAKFRIGRNGGPAGVRMLNDSAAAKLAADAHIAKFIEDRKKRINSAFAEPAANEPVTPPEPPKGGGKPEDLFAKNKVFTSAAVDAARARLKSKLTQINSGVDPEMMMDGLTISGAYLEAGVRKFADYAKAMTDDFGDAIKPYLLSFYEAARHYPGVETDGMSTPKVAQAQHDAMMVEAAEVVKPAAVADTGSKEIENDTRPNAQDATGSAKGQAADRIRQDETGGNAGDLFGQPDLLDDGINGRSTPAGDQRSDNGGQAGVRGKSDAAPANAEQPVQGGRGNSTEPSNRADRKPVSAAGSNYRIAEGELAREGSWAQTADRNLDVVELVKTLATEKRKPTDAERAQLAKFTGWGASEIANGIFPNQYGNYKTDAWRARGERLQSLLTPEEYAQAKRTTQYAHYTSEGVIRSIYNGLERLGFKGGTIVEPGMGIGSFAGLMPDGIAANSHYTGIEYDPITGAIAKALYPQSNITVGDFTKTALPKDFFDAAIGNPPFSSTLVLNDPEYKSKRPMLHDYFFMKTLDRVKPGGLLVFVTSKGTMDKTSDKSRSYLADRANLLGAVRLPQTAFQANAGTEVVTDVIFLQKRGPGIPDNGVKWLDVAPVKAGDTNVNVNEYFAAHPEMVLGEHSTTGSMYRKDEYTVTPREGSDIEADFAKAVLNLPENVSRPVRGSMAERALVQDRDFNPKHKKEGGLYVSDDGNLMQVEDGTGVQLDHRTGADGKKIAMTPKQKKWLRDYVGVRDALKQAQYDQLNDGPWEKSLKALNKAYEAFTKANGPILDYTVIERTNADGTTTETKRYKNEPLLRMDAEGALAYALEKVKEDGTIVKGAALNERVLKRPSEPEIKTTNDALFVSLNRTGALNIEDVAALAGTDKETVLRDLGTAVYEAPGGQWQLADEYTSGNVLKKLKEAQAAAKIDKRYNRNVEALLAVQPKPLGPADISVRLGANWVPASDIEAFAKETLDQRADVTYSHLTGQWNVTPYGRQINEWNTDKVSAGAILDAVLNNRQIKVTWRDNEGKTHTDLEATEKANDVAGKMKDAFRSWIWKDTARAGRLVQHYNDNFNNIAPRQFDGSHLTLPGMTSRFVPHAHQKRGVWRVIQQGDTYLAHAVGAGKTAEMIMAGMEERRLGLSQKPMYIVPNHMLAQFSREFLELYPAANIMVADENNFHTHNRKRFIAQAALNNPDAIVITHSAFGRVGMSDEFTTKFVKNQIAEWQAALADADSNDRITVKQIEKRIEGLEKKLEGKTGKEKKDQVMTFEELGADRLFVDEFHEFRKLDFPTNQGNIKGIDPNGSQKSLDLFMKVQYLRDKKPGRVLVGASGTPVTNTMGELFTAQRFFQPQQLEEDGLTSFDAWASQYGDVATGFEQNAAGGYEMVSRFAKFVNVPELMRRVRSFMDILTGSNLGALVQRPDVETGSRQIKVTPAPLGYKAYQKTLEARIKKIRETKGKPVKGADIILKVIGDGRFSAIDMRFVDSTLPSDPNSKLNQLIDDVITDYKATADFEYHTDNKTDPIKGASLMVFSDIGLGEQSAISRGFDMRAWMEQRFTEAGIPKEHVAFMRDYKQSAKKERLFADMREGKRRILIGGKEMETGTNVQKRLFKMYQLDAPWFPASVEQREGRIVRQGNQNPEVGINAYATKGSYDSTMWGMNARKARFIEQAMNGDDTVRSLEDVSEASAFEMAAALASGDERYMRLAGLKAEVEKMDRLRHAHHDEQNTLKRERHYATDRIERNEALIADLNKAIAKRKPVPAGEFSGNVGKQSFDNREEFSMALFDEFKRLGDNSTDGVETLATVGGFPIKFYGIERKGSGFTADLHVDIPGDPSPLLGYPIDPGVAINGLATRALNQINGMDRHVAEAKQTIATSQRTLDQISKRVGAAFPEEQILLEKVSELEALQEELAKESVDATAATEAAVATAQVEQPATEAVPDEEPRYSVRDDGKPVAEFGPVHDEFRDNPAGAIDRLLKDKDGEAVAAVVRPDLGEISLVYGTDAYGLKHIADRRGAEFFKRLPDLLKNGTLYSKPNQVGRVFIGNEGTEAAIRLDWSGEAKTWLVSAYDKYPEASAPVGTTNRDTANRGTSGVPKSQRSDVVMQRAEDAGKGLDIPTLDATLRGGALGGVIGKLIDSGDVKLYSSVKKLPKGLGGAKGIQAVTAADGSIHMVSSTLVQERAQAVLLHEMYHGGTKALIGNEQWANLQGRLASLYRQSEQSSGKAREFWDKARARVEAAKRQGGVTTKFEVEEFGAYAIEEYESAPASVRKWVDDLVGAIKAWLVQRFGKQIGDVTPAQLRALAVAALRAQISPTPGDGARYSIAPADPVEAEAGLTPPEQGMLRRVQGLIQDNMNRVKQVQDRISKQTGAVDLGYADYYGAETNRPGRVAARLEDMERNLTKPLMTRLAKAGYTAEQLSELLHAEHAQERNERVAAINPEMPDGGSGMTTEEADAILEGFRDDKELHLIAQQARNIAKQTLALKLEYGLITQEDFDALAAAYKNYVPLKGDGEYGPKVKRAMGHEGRDEHILENIARDYSQAVAVGEKNLARQSLLAMVLQNPDPELWTVGVPPKGRYVAGQVYNIVHNGKTVGSFSSRSQVDAFLEAKGADAINYEILDSNGDQVREFTKRLQNNEVLVYVAGDPVRIQINDEALARQLRPLDQGQMNVVLEKMRGMNRYLSKIYTGYNPSFILRNAARDAMTGSINMVGNEGVKTAAKAWARYPAAVTALARWAATGKTPGGKTGEYLTEYRLNGGKTGASWMSDLEQQGKTLTRLYEDAYGAAGYLNDGKVGRAAKVAGRKAIGGMAHVIEIANQATENALRLALYMQMREDGARPSIAAQAAKAVTVDFDRKGSATGALSALYLFVNPAIQGTANAAKTLHKGKHKYQAAAAISLLPLLGLFAAGAGMDDDKDRWLGRNWDTRTKNFIYHVGSHEIRVPLSQEYAPFYAAGAAIGEALRGESPMKSSARLMSSFLDAYVPLQGMFSSDSDNHGADAGLALVPTVAQPLARSIANRNVFGSQIVPENDFTKDRPDNMKMFRGTKNSVFDSAAQAIASDSYKNDASKVSPETLKMLWSTYTGGLGTFVTDSIGLAKMSATDSEGIDSGKVPFVKDFYRPNAVAPIRSRFYELSKDAREAAAEFKEAKKAGDGEAMDKILRDPSKAELIALEKLAKSTAKASAKLRDEAVDINADKSLTPAQKRAQLKALEVEEEAVLREGISAFK